MAMPIQALQHERFVEIRLSGRLGESEVAAQLPSFARDSRRTLVDYTDVTEIEVPPARLAKLAERGQRQGVRIAVVAPTALTFGFNRQVLQIATDDEGRRTMVFRSRPEALAWLMAG